MVQTPFAVIGYRAGLQLFFFRLWRLRSHLHIPQMGDIVEYRLPPHCRSTFCSIPVTGSSDRNSAKVAPARKNFPNHPTHLTPRRQPMPCNGFFNRATVGDESSSPTGPARSYPASTGKTSPGGKSGPWCPAQGLTCQPPQPSQATLPGPRYGPTRTPLAAPGSGPSNYAATTGAVAVAVAIDTPPIAIEAF